MGDFGGWLSGGGRGGVMHYLGWVVFFGMNEREFSNFFHSIVFSTLL